MGNPNPSMIFFRMK